MKTHILDTEAGVASSEANLAIESLAPHYRNHQIIATITTRSAGPFNGKIEEITADAITIRPSEDDEEAVSIARCDIIEFTSDISRVGRLAVA